jgi:pimeloyl-ACP methyl ester carboxylesterase
MGQTGLVVMDKEQGAAGAWSSLSPETRTANLHHLARYQVRRAFETRPQHLEREDIRDIPKWWVSGALDPLFSLEVTERFIAQGGFEHHVRLEGADHTPHLSDPEGLVDVLLRCAGIV